MRERMHTNQSSKLFPNTYLGNWEADVFEVTKSGYLYEYEVKITRADFKKDAEKCSGWVCNKENGFIREDITKFNQLREGKRVNYFYYLVPEGLITVDELPEFAGLIYINTKYRHPSFKTVKVAPKLSTDKITDQRMMKLYESSYYRFHDYRRQLFKT